MLFILNFLVADIYFSLWARQNVARRYEQYLSLGRHNRVSQFNLFNYETRIFCYLSSIVIYSIATNTRIRTLGPTRRLENKHLLGDPLSLATCSTTTYVVDVSNISLEVSNICVQESSIEKQLWISSGLRGIRITP